jgi:ABC-type nitrate/sulfonate/bicarbonate transport system substrate-binding protein
MPDFPFEVVVAQSKLIQTDPTAVKNYLAALFDAIKFMKSNKAQAVQLFSKDMETPPDVASQTYDYDIGALSDTGKISLKGFENVANGIVETKAVDKAPNVQSLVDPQFVGTK